MWLPNSRRTLFAAMSIAFFSGYYALSYSDLEALGIKCTSMSKFKCDGYRNNLTYIYRSCQCDHSCTAYKDCCIDAMPSRAQVSRPPPRTDVECLHYGENRKTGVYAISKCSSNWNGPSEVRERCQGLDDFRDPLTAIPATDVLRNETYRNLACAECNNANLELLTFFLLKLVCRGVTGLTKDEVMGGLTYNEQLRLWGISRSNRFGNGTVFTRCGIIFDVPLYLKNNVRFCRSNLISECAADWKRPEVAEQCGSYMTVVYSRRSKSYRNPHCAICNHKSIDKISCHSTVSAKFRPKASFGVLMDYNPQGGDTVGMGQCPSGHKYDPFSDKCRNIVCALTGYVVEGEKCAKA